MGDLVREERRMLVFKTRTVYPGLTHQVRPGMSSDIPRRQTWSGGRVHQGCEFVEPGDRSR